MGPLKLVQFTASMDRTSGRAEVNLGLIEGPVLPRHPELAGARIINLSSALIQPSPKGENKLEQTLNDAAHHGAVIVAAAGHQGTVKSSTIIRRLVTAMACRRANQTWNESIGRRALRAPNKTSLAQHDHHA